MTAWRSADYGTHTSRAASDLDEPKAMVGELTGLGLREWLGKTPTNLNLTVY